ncbi:putative serine/threonine-protein kinase F31E3.2-like protein [Amazona aestiva]|uniref:Putative serine/threonine-protein kinase F31E3.2-like protein n=1 Tax=Amazona aestiva TaxID=12930 RepID=A0A0Q3PYR4_AMAAE|nr:putative serine/threonine-protein kinase F31E3.2-like protein [Amazona aestiva]
MAPEVLSGGPYSHAADWWSLGVLLFALASGEFPVAPAGDHVAMLERVKQSSYESPPAFSPALARLMAELLCHNPLHRLRYLHHFQGHPFFRGVAFDADLLQKDPVAVAVAPQPSEQPPPDPATFDDFDCDLEASHQLEEASVALQDTAAKLEQLTVANSRLSADHSSLMSSLASLEQERDARQLSLIHI